MIRLIYSDKPAWIDLYDDMRVLVRPFTSALLGIARAEVEKIGADLPPKARFVLLATELAKLAIIEWEGVADQDDQPAPVTPETIAAAMDFWVVNEAFQSLYVTPGLLMGAEKKPSATAPDGTSATVRNTVQAAPAHAQTVPTKSTRHKPSKARKSGIL